MSNLTWTKNYDELGFNDDFMFGITMQDSELCREVIERLTEHSVGHLQDVHPQKEFRFTSDGKPIKLDIYTRDDRTVYDAEMQNLNRKSVKSLELPRRTRFYQSSIDMDHINRGNPFSTLPDSKILFICTFDPFGLGLPKYTFRECCNEESTLVLSDGTEKVFFNCCYTGKNISRELRNFYEYVKYGTVTDELTKRLNAAVCEARKNEEWRSRYMKERLILQDAKEEGREEGREEERKNTEKERKRAEAAEAKVKELEKLLAQK
jgi:predicted transposase/invertase (TIGR01784 family)